MKKYVKKKKPQRKISKSKNKKRQRRIFGTLPTIRDLTIKEKKPIKATAPQTIRLSEEDRITYTYEYEEGKSRQIRKLFVSYEVLINNDWKTIFRYDNHEDEKLHKHYSLKGVDIKSFAGVIQNGSPRKWLTWAIKDLQNNFYEYKRLFFKSNNHE